MITYNINCAALFEKLPVNGLEGHHLRPKDKAIKAGLKGVLTEQLITDNGFPGLLRSSQ